MKKLIYAYALFHVILSGIGFLGMVALFFISLGTDGSAMIGIAAAAMFLNMLFFASLAYAIKN